MCKDQEPVSGLSVTLCFPTAYSPCCIYPDPSPDHKPLRLPTLTAQPRWVFQGEVQKRPGFVSTSSSPHSDGLPGSVIWHAQLLVPYLSSPVVPLSWFAILFVTNCPLICLLTQTLSLRVFVSCLSCSSQPLPHSGEFMYLLADYHRV